MYHMKINCIFCHTPAVIRNNNALMACMCDDEFRTAPIDQIKYGFHSDRVYLLEINREEKHEKNCDVKT